VRTRSQWKLSRREHRHHTPSLACVFSTRDLHREHTVPAAARHVADGASIHERRRCRACHAAAGVNAMLEVKHISCTMHATSRLQHSAHQRRGQRQHQSPCSAPLAPATGWWSADVAACHGRAMRHVLQSFVPLGRRMGRSRAQERAQAKCGHARSRTSLPRVTLAAEISGQLQEPHKVTEHQPLGSRMSRRRAKTRTASAHSTMALATVVHIWHSAGSVTHNGLNTVDTATEQPFGENRQHSISFCVAAVPLDSHWVARQPIQWLPSGHPRTMVYWIAIG
jgi:hypothetical protein